MSENVYIKTFGCQMNERDSEIIEQLLYQDGYHFVDSMLDADVVILNTCSVREKAEQKVFSLLGRLREQKKKQPDLLIGVAGCVAQQNGTGIFRRMPQVDFVVGTQKFYQIPLMLRSLREGKSRQACAVELNDTFTIPPFQKDLCEDTLQFQGDVKRFVTIMQGCNNYCSYCVVPYTRGREVSRPVDDIIEEVQVLVAHGVREITLLGQNVNSYGLTNAVSDHPVGFPQLLRQVSAISGVKRLRFTTSNPKDLSDELIDCFADLDNLCPAFHLPVQSGSNRMLKLMNRKYTIEQYIDQVEKLRQTVPDIALYTDMIIGFPGEMDEDFEQTVELLQRLRYHGSFSFKYSDRPNVRSANFKDKVPEKVKKERLTYFQELQTRIRFERNSEYIEKTFEVMVEKVSGEAYTGRTPTNHIVHFAHEDGLPPLLPGDFVYVTIHYAGNNSLKGKFCPQRS